MNELIKGVEILKVNNFYQPTLLCVLICIGIIALGVVVGNVVANKTHNDTLPQIILGASIFIAFVLILIPFTKSINHLSKQYSTEYECYLHEDKIDYKEFYEKCEVLKQEGKIYTIKLKEDK